MSIFDNIFGKGPSYRKNNPYDLHPSDPDYDYYAGLRADEETAQGMLDAVKGSRNMPPLEGKESPKGNAVNQAGDNMTEGITQYPVDAEHEPYTSWSKDNMEPQTAGDKPAIVKSSPTANPNIPIKPVVEPLRPYAGSYPPGRYSDGFGHKGKFGSEFGTKYPRQPLVPRIPEKEVFAFVVENSEDTLKQRESILQIISQTVEKKKDAIFLFVKVGNDAKPFPPMDYESVKKENIISSLISQADESNLPNLASALFYLVNKFNIFASGTDFYKLGNSSIVFIGTGVHAPSKDSNQVISSCISKLQNISKLKAFKYFCIKDSDAIRVSSLGFPVIGHIVSDFYE